MGVSVRHNSRLAALVALAAAVMTVAWFSRALQTESTTDWLWCLVVASVALVQLLVIRDGRAPLLVADDQGVRVRRGETWSGLRWQDIAHVEVRSPASWLRDGKIVVHPRDLSGDVLDDAEAAAPATTGEAYVVPLARTTRIDFDGMTGDLVEDLDALASGRVPVLVLTRVETSAADGTGPAPKAQDEKAQHEKAQHEEAEDAERAQDEEPHSAEAPPATSLLLPQQPTAEHPATARPAPPADQPATIEVVELPIRGEQPSEEAPDAATQLDSPQAREAPEAQEAQGTRGTRGRVRNGLRRWAVRLARFGAEPAEPRPEAGEAGESGAEHDEPEFEPVHPTRETRPAARSEVALDSVRMLPHPPAIPAQRSAESPVVVARVDDFAASEPRPAPDALIGPLIAAARNRARLSIDTLSERTRIRPHVLECIEVDDFEACGGDFYARGHLRTLARIFGLEAQQLLDLYDDHYAKAEIEARQVFEAELATGIGGGVRATHTGPRWSLLAACVLALASIWGVARVFNDTPQELVSPAPNVVDSAGLAKSTPAPKMTLATLEVSATGASPQVVVRDRDGLILWAGKLAEGQHQQVIGMAPFDVTASNGSAVKVSFLGKAKGAVGDSAAAGSKQFG
jgi:hypothetical protein